MSNEKCGFRVPYVVEETKDKGLGVFAAAAIKQGSVVWQYVQNQYVVFDERSFNEAIAQLSRAEVVYELTHVFGLKEFPGCLIRIRDDGVLVNHSSKPNTATKNSAAIDAVPDESSPQYLSDVALALLDDRYAMVATRDIEEGEELTMDYDADVVDPLFYDVLVEKYGVNEDYLSDR